MKKLLLILMTSLLLCCCAAAEDLALQPLGGEEQAQALPTALDDMTLGERYDIPGYARVLPVTFGLRDSLRQYSEGAVGQTGVTASSGQNKEYAMLYIDLVNLHQAPHAFMAEASVLVVFDGEYQFIGWVRQYDPDLLEKAYADQPAPWRYTLLQPADERLVEMVYTGHYVFGCTLPDAVVEGDEPLRVEITLGGHELTYHIRK